MENDLSIREMPLPEFSADDAGLRADDLPVTRIEARGGWQAVNVRELWQFRELLYFLTWRDVKVRYKQTLLGRRGRFCSRR